MKYFFTVFILVLLASKGLSQSVLIGNVYYQSSGRTPAVGVEIVAEGSNGDHSKDMGEFTLMFPVYDKGRSVNVSLGGDMADARGKKIELVNGRELQRINLPDKAENSPIEIIVCPKGSRDLAAQKYYRIFKTSADIALANTKKELDLLLNEREKDYQKISDMIGQIGKLEQQIDSLRLYKDAFYISSINKDDASRRVLEYMRLLDEGKSIQEAREVLSPKEASEELAASTESFNNGIEELEIRAKASMSIFDYKDASMCYDTIIHYSEKMGIDRLKIASYYSDAAIVLLGNGEYSSALFFQKKAIEILEENLDINKPYLAKCYNNISLIYQGLGLFETALKFQEKSTSLAEEFFDAKDTELAFLFCDLGFAYSNVGDYETSIQFQERGIAILEEVLDKKDLELAIPYHNLGLVYSDINQYDLAINFLNKGISIKEELLGPWDRSLGRSYGNIGLVYHYKGHYDSALLFKKKGILILENNLNPKHPDLAIFYDNLGATYCALDLNDSALIYQKKAIVIMEDVFDAKNPFLATTYDNIAGTYRQLRDFERSVFFYRKGISIREEISPEHPSLGFSYANVALVYHYINENETSLEFYRKGITRLEKTLSPIDLNLATVYTNISQVYLDLKQYDSAIEFQEKVISLMKLALPSNHPKQQVAIDDLINIYQKRVSVNFNKREYKSALEDFDKIQSLNGNLNFWEYIGYCHYNLEDYPQAIEAYLQYYSLSTEVDPNFHNNIGCAFVKNKQFEEAHKAFSEFEKLMPNEGRTFRNWAMFYALQKEKENALLNLQKAIDMGYKDIEWLETDFSLKNIRKDPRFTEILEKLKSE